MDDQWIYEPNDVEVLDTVLGRGAYGEVRVARWKGTEVAAKRLHFRNNEELMTREEHDAIMSSLHQEIAILSQLRHPNLVLFLGVCRESCTDAIPTTILTELMPLSLYDLLEGSPSSVESTFKLSTALKLEEVIDVTMDVSLGLEYLHSRSPPIIHRDISSKNILIGGNRAKIADLGQAKIVSTTLSRQTGIPGAMAYIAPEVLTGRYTEKIDIFSLGIVMVQMVTGEYPKIEKREEQQKKACTQQSALRPLINSMLEYQPMSRPSAMEVCSKLNALMANDRYYSPARKTLPQSDVSILACRWIQSQVEERCRDTVLALEQTTRRLNATEARWREEADRADAADKKREEAVTTMKEADSNAKSLRSKLQSESEQLSLTQQMLLERDTRIKDMMMDKTRTDKLVEDLRSRLQTMEEQLTQEHDRAEALSRDLEQSQLHCKGMESENESMRSQMRQMRSENDELTEDVNELETRLEQALFRWKQENERTAKETERCDRLRDSCNALTMTVERRDDEIATIRSRLREYETLPLPVRCIG